MRTRKRGKTRGRIIRFCATRATLEGETETIETSVAEMDLVAALARFPEFGTLLVRIVREYRAAPYDASAT